MTTSAWLRRDPDNRAVYAAVQNANARAKHFGAPGHIAARDVRRLWREQPVCVRCGEGRGLDHILTLSRGGTNTPDNLQNLCHGCNSSKSWEDRRPRSDEAA